MRKYQRIHIEIPENIDGRYKKLYQKKSSYLCPRLSVKSYHNVFVSHEGLCWQYGRLLPYSAFNICTSYDKSFGLQFYKLVSEQYLVSTFGKSLQKLVLDDNENYAIIHTKWQNYSFWIMSSLVRLLMLIESKENFILLYPEEWDNIKYIQDSLKFFPSLRYKRIPAGVHVQVKNLLLPENRPFTACFNGFELQSVHDYFIEKVSHEIEITQYYERVFVTRKKAKYRKIVNEQDVIQLVEKYGFVVVDFDDLSFLKQVTMMSKVKYLIQIHGAGMANIVFTPKGTQIIELLHEYNQPSTYRFTYWTASEVMKKKYTCTFNKLVGNLDDSKIIRNDLFVDLFVDLFALEQHIKQVLVK